MDMYDNKLYEKFGPWALVTGASSGIGYEFAKRLAQLGFNLALVARSVGKLTELSDELESTYGIETRVIDVDLSSPDSADVIYVRCIDLNIGLLVSDAGSVDMGRFLNFSLDNVRRSVQLNVSTHVELAHYLGQRFVSTRDSKGGIIFMSSIFGMQGIPYVSTYAAAKAYLISFAEAMHHEYKRHGMHITAMVPGPVDTPLLNRAGVGKFFEHINLPVLTPSQVVESAISALLDNKAVFMPDWRTRLKFGLLRTHLLSREANVIFWGKAVKKYIHALLSPAYRKELEGKKAH